MADSLDSMNRTNPVCKVYETSLKIITSQPYFSRRESRAQSTLLAHVTQVITRKVRETQKSQNTFLIWNKIRGFTFCARTLFWYPELTASPIFVVLDHKII